MEFKIEYSDHKDPSTRNWSVTLLTTLLNNYLIDKHHGFTYSCINITMHNDPVNPKIKAKLRKGLDDYHAEVEVYGSFKDNRAYSVIDLVEGVRLVKWAAKLVDDITLKIDKDYQLEKLLNDISHFESTMPKSNQELIDLSGKKKEMDSNIPIKKVDGYIKAWKENPRELKRWLIGIRTYDHFEKDALMPYRYMFDDIFSTVLRGKGILTPRYQEIYFSIDKTLDDAKRKNPLWLDYWHRYTYCTLDLDKYQKSTESVKEKMVFESLCDGLRLIADFDHLDSNKIEEAIAEIKAEGVKIVMTYIAKDHKNYLVEIKYQINDAKPMEVPFYLHLTDKLTGKRYKAFIDNFIPMFAGAGLAKIQITKDEVIIKGGGGVRGEASRQIGNLKDEYRFNINHLKELELHST